ncbi:Gx transporter family protein [Treponema zioleckii]|uniref:Gx transporter family protein n=1 Tax=Treponema zioleckii TaxID=331680 RepID=UPI00168B2F1F|nr:Gx transporter family protein [Treponema zioleckii]
MQFPDKNKAATNDKLANLVQKTLFYAWAESALPRVFPFFKFGLSNATVVCALNFPLKSFFFLAVFKSVAANLTAGTLFSPFFLISLIQSIFSALLMYIAAKLPKKIISLYGISIFGAASSSFIQIFLYRFYLGTGSKTLLAPMLIFSIFSGTLTAFLASKIKKEENEDFYQSDKTQKSDLKNDLYLFFRDFTFSKTKILFLLGIFLISSFIFITDNFLFLLTTLLISLAAQKFLGQTIKILPYIFLWIFVILSAALVPQGKVLFKLQAFSLTEDALVNGIIKALKLSASAALSHAAIPIIFRKKNA